MANLLPEVALLEAEQLDKNWGWERWIASVHPIAPARFQGSSIASKVQFPYLIKTIQANQNLSIQVHPTDEYARVHENDSGKAECWIVLEAEKNAGIYLGLKNGVTKKEFMTAVQNGEDADRYVNFFRVKPGEFFYIPPGIVHSLGAGIRVLEVQQSSGITYRIFDWNRLVDGKPRELHVEKAFDVLDDNDDHQTTEYFHHKSSAFSDSQMLYCHRDFEVYSINIEPGEEFKVNPQGRPATVILLNGDLQIGDLKTVKEQAVLVNQKGVVATSQTGAQFALVI